MAQPSKKAKKAYAISEKGRANRRAHYEANKEKYREYERNRQYMKMYGITVDDYNRMYEAQRGVCKICGTTEPKTAGGRYFVVDHCHTTGKVRGLLCNVCNVAVGFYELHAKKIENYLEQK